MKKFRVSILPIIIVVLCVAGCPPPQEEPKEKPATPEEIRAEGQAILQDINALSNASPEQVQSQIQQLRARMRPFREQHGRTDDGRIMIDSITSKVFGNANRLFEREEYHLCVFACDLALTINPSHARTLDLKKRAQEELNRPRVELGGLLNNESGEVFAFVNITYLTTGQTDSKQVQVGDEFDGYRFKNIAKDGTGKPTGIVVRWIKTSRDVSIPLHP